MKVDGMLKIPGNLDTEELSVDGVLRVLGNVSVISLDGNGLVRIKGSLEASRIDMDGVLKVENAIKTDQCQINGLVKAQSLEGEIVTIDGGITIDETVNCENLKVLQSAKSHIQTIECAKLEVKHKRSLRLNVLSVDSITADDINVEYVKCNKMTGNKIVIGPNCDIDFVEYQSTLQIHEKAKVKKQQKIEV